MVINFFFQMSIEYAEQCHSHALRAALLAGEDNCDYTFDYSYNYKGTGAKHRKVITCVGTIEDDHSSHVLTSTLDGGSMSQLNLRMCVSDVLHLLVPLYRAWNDGFSWY